jgi:hypothetical protein
VVQRLSPRRELTRQIELQREYVRDTAAYVDTKAVWSIAATIVLPPVLATAMVVWTYAVAWWRIWPARRPVLAHRWIFSAATVLCGTRPRSRCWPPGCTTTRGSRSGYARDLPSSRIFAVHKGASSTLDQFDNGT